LGAKAGYNLHLVGLFLLIWLPDSPSKRPVYQFTQGKRGKLLISNSYASRGNASNREYDLSYCPEGDFFII
jgi:hypothetical protein